MKKRIAAMLFALSLCLGGAAAVPANAGVEFDPVGAEELRIGEEYWLECGEEGLYRFTAPTPECFLTEQELKEIDGSLYGLPVVGHKLYSASGAYLGIISYSNDSELGGWTAFEPGETYYLEVKARDKDGQFFTFSPVLPEKDGTASQERERTVALTEENVEKFIPGETAELWDVYTVTERFSAVFDGELCMTDFFILPCEAYFDGAELTVSSGKVTYSAVERCVSETAGEAKVYEKAAFSAEPGPGLLVYAANLFSYVKGDGKKADATLTYRVSVPSGKRLIDSGDGYFRAADAHDIYSDVSENIWYTRSITYCAEKGYMTGMPGGIFSPGTPLTRAQTAQILARIAGADLSKYAGKQSFSDVKPGAWYAKAVEWARENGVTSGVGGGLFAPDKAVTRQELAVFARALAGVLGITGIEPASLGPFIDREDVSPWAKDSMAWAVGAGLFAGTSVNKLSPKLNASRAQISRIVMNFAEGPLSGAVPSPADGSYFLEGGTCGYGVYQEMIDMTGKEEPKMLYIGLPCADPSAGYEGIAGEFEYRGCTTDLLTLEDLADGRAEEKIKGADLIWVTGGSSRMLIARLQRYGADKYLREAAANGTVMCGSSAGAICFGRYGTSGTGPERYMNLAAVGCADIVVCPHGFETERVGKMKELLAARPGLIGVAVDGGALEIHGGMFRVYTDKNFKSSAYKYKYADGEFTEEDINSPDWRPLSELFG